MSNETLKNLQEAWRTIAYLKEKAWLLEAKHRHDRWLGLL